MSDLLPALEQLVSELKAARSLPNGPRTSPDEAQVAGTACVKLCRGNQDTARTLWKIIADDCGGYMPHAAAVTLIRASRTDHLVPDIEAPDPT